ncbi:unnamed protein product [Ranitomeya imitator]|uniref:Beta-1,4-galactosyltransferase 2 n=1 Tax=Ranitomeya imitator TaxID=111125 RepID=A0ABN9KU34_9NEOB|nr:unnamed protein product [Ranitomeya imitator]
MSRLLLAVTLERVCKAVLLLCLVHFVIIMILYFDVYAQRLDFFTRFSVRNASRLHPYYNFTRPNGTAHSYTAETLPASAKPDPNQTATEKPLPPCPDSPPGLVGRLLIEFSSLMSLERVQRGEPRGDGRAAGTRPATVRPESGWPLSFHSDTGSIT